MKGFGAAAASAAVLILSGAGGAYAADLATKAPVLKAAPADAACTSIVDFFTTACQLAAYGVRIYGTIDAGVGYQTNGSPFDKLAGPGVNYFPGKMNYGGKWLMSPNALSQSNIGVQIKESLGLGWSFVGQLETQFDPMSMTLANSAGSVNENVGKSLFGQTTAGDGGSQGKFYNGLGFAGFSNDTWGTITAGRQNTLMRDAILSYDPMGSSYAFSVLGFFGAWGGGGLTEDGKATTSVKYRVNVSNWHFGVMGQFGGYDEGNGSRGAVYGDIGADYNVGPGIFSADVTGGYTKDAVTVGLTGGVTGNQSGTVPYFVNPNTAQSLAATLSDNENIMVSAKYTWDKLKLYAGYEWLHFANPSDPVTSLTEITGAYLCQGCLINGLPTTINTTNFTSGDKVLQLFWTGARYSITSSLDVAVAYYHETQNNFSGAACVVAVAGSKCNGTMDAASILLDWQFAPKWDTYIGTQYSQWNGGLANGLLATNNLATTGGVRFRW
jgi:predicted porin